jgi:ABC-type molybdate transport system permease subunit
MSSIPTDLAKSRLVKHCKSCWRPDIHVPVKFPPVVHGFLTVITFGLILIIRPSRCVCCGTKRIF